ncbi:MAG: fimbrillin family protein [Parabacteroides gordonii]|uniref:fimbrillin family protein n=1 Tax=Parabacteroides gordonii TaxID=574930 RepID=UPI003A8A5E66
MNTFLKYILFSFLFVLSSCSGEDVFVANGQSPRDALVLTVSAGDFVTDGNPATRAVDDGATTTFENDDKVGVIILDDKGNLLSNNVPYKYNNGSWSFESIDSKTQCYYDSKAKTYIVYYPYSTEADNITSEVGLKTKFPPQADQSMENNYRASDLLVWTSTSGPLKTLAAELKHAYASVSVSPSIKCKLANNEDLTYVSSKISGVGLTISNKSCSPYLAEDGSYRYILPTGFSTGDVSCTLTFNGTKYSSKVTVSSASANTRYTFVPTVNDGDYGLDKAQIGDFYCKDSKDEGYLIPGDIASLTTEQQAACIGIVYSTDASRIGTAATKVLEKQSITPHGLVMALTNASDGCRWGNENTNENSSGDEGAPFKDDTDQLQKQYNNVDGYGETHWIIEAYESNGTTLKDTYTAFYHASLYGTAESSTGKYAVPSNTTGWFIPGMGQWWDILSNLGKIDLTNYRDDTGSYTYISGAAPIAVANMNTYLQKISGATPFRTDTYFWSSSEYSGSHACNVNFFSNGRLTLTNSSKNYSYYRVRCSFAF